MLFLCVFGTPERDSSFKAADKAMKGLLRTLAKEEKFSGKAEQRLLADSRGALEAKRIGLLGAGDRKAFDLTQVRNLAANATRIGNAKSAKKIAFAILGLPDKDQHLAAQFVAEGAALGLYKFDKYQAKQSRKIASVRDVTVITSSKANPARDKAIGAGMKRARAVAAAVCQARDLVNEPAAYMTPRRMAATARALAKKHARLQVKVLGEKECEKLGMGMFLAVGQGSNEDSRLIHLTYTPKGKAKSTIALIGKGVTFDSGGYSLKPSSAMEDMKIDMAGSAAVVAAMGAIAEIGCPHEVHAIAACCENLVSGRAYKLGDVLKAMDGTTVEINNTDAEGRLTLGDAITYTRTKVKPDEIFDFATLTGACMVALGPFTAGVLSPNDKLAKRWLAAAEVTGEDMWRLPLTPRLRDQLKSAIASMRNTGERWGGAITAGLFLKNFAKDVPWLHVDIAGPASANSTRGAVCKGGTGYAVSTIVEYITR